MRPTFSSSTQAAAFCLLLVVLLGLPAIVAKIGSHDRRDVYPAVPAIKGAFPWAQQKIFGETGDVDLAFLGSSQLWFGVNTSHVKQEFSRRLGREAEVFTLGWGDNGFDAVYMVARDLLEHRRVRALVVYDEDLARDAPHPQAFHWFRMGDYDEELAGLSKLAQVRFYGSAVLGMPRQLLSLARPNLLEDPAHSRDTGMNVKFRAPNFAQHDGALRSQLAFDWKPDFVPFEPTCLATPRDVLIYSPEIRSAFRFAGEPRNTLGLQFARKLARLCQEQETRLIFLHMPVFKEWQDDTVSESQRWPEILEAPADLVGISPARLFFGLSGDEVRKLYLDELHFNQNGQDFFTPVMTPALFDLCFPAHR